MTRISTETPISKQVTFATENAVVGNILLHKILSAWFTPENMIQNMKRLKPANVIRWAPVYYDSLVYFLGEHHVETVEFMRGMEPYKRLIGQQVDQ